MTGKTRILLGGGALIVVLCLATGATIYFMTRSTQQTVTMPATTSAELIAPSSPAAQVAASPNDPAGIAKRLASPDESVRREAIDYLHSLDNTDQHALGVGLPKWGPALLAGGYYDDAEELAELVVTRRALDPPTLEAGQRYRVQAFIAHSKSQTLQEARSSYWTTTLQEAKGYYNAAALSDSAEAANMLAEALSQTAGATAAAEFLKQQADADVTGPTSQPSAILKNIQCNTSHYQFAIDYLKGRVGSHGASFPSLISQADYYLIDDDPDNARACFEAACRVAGTRAKQVRDGVEGVARSMRAQDGNVAHSNAFIESLRKDPAEDGAALTDNGPDSPRLSDLKAAANAIKLADMSGLDKTPG